MIFLNFGHASTPVANAPDELERVNVPVQVKNHADPQEISGTIISLLAEHADHLRGQRPIIGLPGASLIATILVSQIAGLTGNLPRVLVAQRTPDGFVYDFNFAADLDTERNEVARPRRVDLGL